MKEVFAVVGVIIAILSYIPYLKDTLSRKTKPHAFTWFVWSLMTVIAFFAQVSEGAGVGSAILGVTAVVSFVIFGIALRYGRTNIAPIDWAFLAAAILALAVWFLTNDPVWSVILITFIDATAFGPTFRKAYIFPHSETLISFMLSGVKHALVLASLEIYTTSTVLYSFYLVLANVAFAGMLILRRAQHKKNLQGRTL